MSLKKILPHLLAIITFVLLTVMYVTPAYKGKQLEQHDIRMSVAPAKELNDFKAATGRDAWWTNSMFSGMPAFMLSGGYPNSISTIVGSKIVSVFPVSASLMLLQMLGMYLLLLVLGARSWLSVLGAIAYTLATYNMVIIPAGHVSKSMSLGYAPMVLAALIMIFQRKYLLGSGLMAFFVGLEVYSNNPQITYYLGLLIVFVVIGYGIQAFQTKQLKSFFIGLLVAALGASIGLATNTMRLWNTAVYAEETIRGKSELSPLSQAKSSQSGKNGLDEEYAFTWSYGIAETGNLLIPNLYGGSNGTSLGGEKSETYKAMVNNSIAEENALQFSSAQGYWGEQPMTGGPAYAGAILLFLFVLACFVVKGNLKWALLTGTIFLVSIAWGKNFFFNTILFNNLPLFNKFRATTSILSVAQISIIILAILGLKQIVETKPSFADLKKPLMISLGLTAGLCLILALVPSIFFDFKPSTPIQLTGNAPVDADIVKGMIADRISLLRTDAFRSFFLIIIAAGLIWAFITNKIKDVVFYPVLILLVTFDMFAIDKRYFNNDKFVDAEDFSHYFDPTPTDNQILQDKSVYRVYDNARGGFSDATASYLHKSVGGYHGAKLKKYAEIIERQISNNNMQVFDMLNTKYFMGSDPKTGQMNVQINPDACGNVWFVPEYKIVANADEEMKSLDKFEPKKIAFIDKRFADQLGTLKPQTDPSDTIFLKDFKSNYLSYESSAKTNQVAVFSEIFYRGNQDWNSYIDGKLTPHFRTDYILRGMVIPAGKHKIEFKFEPVSVAKGGQYDLYASVFMVLFLSVALGMGVKQSFASKE
jgi:hypothetical protein